MTFAEKKDRIYDQDIMRMQRVNTAGMTEELIGRFQHRPRCITMHANRHTF